MSLRELLRPSCVVSGLPASGKRDALERLAVAAGAALDLSSDAILAAVLQREAEGSTGFGGGVAIPHGKLAGLGAVTGYLARLARPVDFDAVDGAPVDLLFLLLAPDNAVAAHLKALAKVSRLLRDADLCDALRTAKTAEAMFAIADGARDRAA